MVSEAQVLGETTIQISFNGLGLIIDVIDVEVSILKNDCASLLRNRDMIINGLDIILEGGYLHIGSLKEPLKLVNFFYVYNWSAHDTPYALCTEDDLRKIHKGFDHPLVRTTYNLLSRANVNVLKDGTTSQFQKITEDCEICKLKAKATRRCRLSEGTEDFRFNHRDIVDTMFINALPVLHMVDESTHFQAACYLKSQTTEEICKSLHQLWILLYLGPLDFSSVDQGSSYIFKEMKSNCEAFGITLHGEMIENTGSIRLVERYHAPLRSAYTKLRQ